MEVCDLRRPEERSQISRADSASARATSGRSPASAEHMGSDLASGGRRLRQFFVLRVRLEDPVAHGGNSISAMAILLRCYRGGVADERAPISARRCSII